MANKYIDAMKSLAASDLDMEYRHSEADKLVIDYLRAKGGHEMADAYQIALKGVWYA